MATLTSLTRVLLRRSSSGLQSVSSATLLERSTPRVLITHSMTLTINHTAYDDDALEPTTNKEELFAMPPSDPRRFSRIKALEPSAYVSCIRDPIVEKFISMMLNIRGINRGDRRRKVVTRDIMYKCIEFIKNTQLEKYHSAESSEERDSVELNPYVIINRGVENCMPLLQLKEVRKGAVLYRVPCPLSEKKKRWQAMRWLIDTARYDKFTPEQWAYERLALELLSAYENTGKVVRQKQEVHKEAENNKAYAHFRWSGSGKGKRRD